MNIDTMKTYSEVYYILNILGEEYINKLPKSLISMLDAKRKKDYNPTFSFEEENLTKDVKSILALLYLNYWCNDENERLELLKVINENEIKYQEELREKYPVDVFRKNNEESKNVEIEKEEKTQEAEVIKYKNNFFRTFIEKIKNIFKKVKTRKL